MGRFLRIAVGSACELDSQIELATQLGLLDPATHLVGQTDILRRRLIRLIDRVLPGA
jgi:four helix bundle protein